MARSFRKRGFILVVVSGALLAAAIAQFGPLVTPLQSPDNTNGGLKSIPQGELFDPRLRDSANLN